ncbi:LytTR family DNA-binding domain-containing protein [Proteiniphilum sp.]|uniref:LytR/AlgR family response regulator transcription factor n=1 Tax=Proteiniphilum sp. TaxID=1926877 RepID=UPI002B2122B0|nr:LytTR family DNA-binding domain-containing protein [Proteiniphilum sp.]MEA4916884.1 LytTR family DNA-binding domain-containing protein [Proteiniphilum sp.]
MKVRCIAIDDEPLALQQLSRYILETDFLELTGSFRNGLVAQKWLSVNSTDAIFVDIEMPGLNGLDFIRSMNRKPLVVFTTAHSEYALEGFKVEATDYLLKPIDYQDFVRSAERLYRQYLLMQGIKEGQGGKHTIFVRSEYKTMAIDIAGIFFIESQSEYVRIFLEDKKPIMSLGSLKSYQETLPPDLFFRVHRSYIVNISFIKCIERKQIILHNGMSLPVGKLYEKELKKYINENIHRK